MGCETRLELAQSMEGSDPRIRLGFLEIVADLGGEFDQMKARATRSSATRDASAIPGRT